MYRLAADVFNDAAMVLDCISPALPKGPRVLLLSASSILRALCGVAAGSSKASLSKHFARWGNLGELNAVSLVHIYTFCIYYDRRHSRMRSQFSSYTAQVVELIGKAYRKR